MYIVAWHYITLDLDDDDDDDEEEDEDEEENADKDPSFSVYSHTPEDLYLDPSGQMVFETNETSGKEPGQGLGQGHAKEKGLLLGVNLGANLLLPSLVLLFFPLHTPFHALCHPVVYQALTPVQRYFFSWRDMVIHEEVVLAEEENITLGGTKGVLKSGTHLYTSYILY